MITLELIKQFCSTDETRAAITAPWLFEGDVVATDSRILIRLQTRGQEKETRWMAAGVNAEGCRPFRIQSQTLIKSPLLRRRRMAIFGAASSNPLESRTGIEGFQETMILLHLFSCVPFGLVR